MAYSPLRGFFMLLALLPFLIFAFSYTQDAPALNPEPLKKVSQEVRNGKTITYTALTLTSAQSEKELNELREQLRTEGITLTFIALKWNEQQKRIKAMEGKLETPDGNTRWFLVKKPQRIHIVYSKAEGESPKIEKVEISGWYVHNNG